MTEPKLRTIAVHVSEETHLRFRCLRAATGLTSAALIARALERFMPEAEELLPDVLADVQGPGELVEVEPPDVAPIPQPATDIDELLAEFGVK